MVQMFLVVNVPAWVSPIDDCKQRAVNEKW